MRCKFDNRCNMLKDWEHIRKYHESTPLQGAIHRKKEAAVRLLLEAKADPNAPGEHTWFKDGPKRPHLTTTVVQGWKAGLTLLLEAGADLFIHPYLLSWLFGEFGTMEQRRRLDCLDVLMAHNAHPLLTECTESGTVIRLLRDWSQEMNDRNQRKHKVLHILATLQKHLMVLVERYESEIAQVLGVVDLTRVVVDYLVDAKDRPMPDKKRKRDS